MYPIIIIIAGVSIASALITRNKKLQQRALKDAEHDPVLISNVRGKLLAGDKDTHIIKYVREETGFSLIEAKHFVDSQK